MIAVGFDARMRRANAMMDTALNPDLSASAAVGAALLAIHRADVALIAAGDDLERNEVAALKAEANNFLKGLNR